MSIKTVNLKKAIIGLFMIGAVFIISLSTEAASESDAIAVRVLPNVNHDSIETWYASQGFSGSPQSLTVDGYEAIRDGRTVFVNAANVDLTSKKIYTNIYLISYNQESETKTLDILGQLVSHWKFNNNISSRGYCSISTMNCQADSDCPSNYICANSNTGSSLDYQAFNKGKCILKDNSVCSTDSDCPANLFCDNLKSRLIRDVKRLGQVSKINEAIESYKKVNGKYPALDSGTYVLGSSLSVWPSWKETLWPQLAEQPIIDPINSLSYCEGYDAGTCWDNKTNSFINSDLSLPLGSYVFAYKAVNKGAGYSLCSSFETKSAGLDTAKGQIMSNSCNSSGSVQNTAPTLVSSSLNGVAGKEFNGYLMAADAEGDSVYWSLAPVSNFSTWSGAPTLVNTNNVEQKKMYAAKTGNVGNYEMNLTLTDSRGASSVTKVILKIDFVGKVTIEANDAVYLIDNTNPFYTFYVRGGNLEKNYNIQAVDSNFSDVFSNDLSEASFISDLDSLEISVPLKMPAAALINESVIVPFRITFSNFGALVTKDINITFKVEKPLLSFQCDAFARVGQPYQMSGAACLLGRLKSGNYNLTYKVTSSIPGLNITTQGSSVYLASDAILTSTPTSSDVAIRVTNQYGLFAENSFKLEVNTFCGDGIKQAPNSEGKGGSLNDGNEQCDGLDGLATSLSTSPDKQYACTTGLNVKTPFPILNNNSCVFANPADGGGYCGDGYCQTAMENCSACRTDCGKCAAVCGDGEVDPGETCDPGISGYKECTTVTEWITPPSYCAGLVNQGNTSTTGYQSCKLDCSGWGKCVGGLPDLVNSSSEACASTNPSLLGYACCELVGCIHDTCDCCGRTKGNAEWLDLVKNSKNIYDYENIIRKLTPDNGACRVRNSAGDNILCECGQSSTDYYGNYYTCPPGPLCSGGGDDPTNNSCVLSQDADNLKNWKVLTNHTAAYYRCWR